MIDSDTFEAADWSTAFKIEAYNICLRSGVRWYIDRTNRKWQLVIEGDAERVRAARNEIFMTKWRQL